MIILNKSNVELHINGNEVVPGAEYDAAEMMFQDLSIHSDIGSVEVVTEYSTRYFSCYGRLTAYESDSTKDTSGLPQIIIEEVS